MEDLSRLCFYCMHLKDRAGRCTYCGKADDPLQEGDYLPLGTTLSSRYVLGRAGRKNSEGVTYVAYDMKTDLPCSVREFFPAALCRRSETDGVSVLAAPGSEAMYEDCRTSFIELWKKLHRLRGLSALIEVTDVFTADNSAYAVFSEPEERTLRDYLLSTPQGYVEWDQARYLFMPVLSTLGTLHTAGLIHKGINPSAFLVTGEGKLKLTDFSIHQARLAFSDLDSDIEDGYAPTEIYDEDGEIGPWTDVYSFCAVLYRALVGSTPISSLIRRQNDQMMIPAKFAEKLPPYVINSLISGMQIESRDRTRNVEQLRSNLSASPRAVSASAKPPLYRRTAIDAGVRDASVNVAPGVTGYQTTTARSSYAFDPKPAAARRPVRLIDEVSDSDEPGARTKVLPKTGIPSQRRPEVDPEEVIARQKQMESRRKTLTILLVVLILVLLVGLGLLVSALFGGSSSPSKPAAPSESQTSAQPGGALPDSFVIPEFRNQYYDQIANDNYYSKLLTLVPVYENSATVASGVIIEQSIAEGTTVNRGTQLRLTVSTGPKQFQLPDVTGYTYEQAVATLCGPLGLELVTGTKYNDGTHVAGTVAETIPAAGTTMSQGGRVTVSFWGEVGSAGQSGATVPGLPAATTQPGETAATTEPLTPATTEPWTPATTVPGTPATTDSQTPATTEP